MALHSKHLTQDTTFTDHFDAVICGEDLEVFGQQVSFNANSHDLCVTVPNNKKRKADYSEPFWGRIEDAPDSPLPSMPKDENPPTPSGSPIAEDEVDSIPFNNLKICPVSGRNALTNSVELIAQKQEQEQEEGLETRNHGKQSMAVSEYEDENELESITYVHHDLCRIESESSEVNLPHIEPLRGLVEDAPFPCDPPLPEDEISLCDSPTGVTTPDSLFEGIEDQLSESSNSFRLRRYLYHHDLVFGCCSSSLILPDKPSGLSILGDLSNLLEQLAEQQKQEPEQGSKTRSREKQSLDVAEDEVDSIPFNNLKICPVVSGIDTLGDCTNSFAQNQEQEEGLETRNHGKQSMADPEYEDEDDNFFFTYVCHDNCLIESQRSEETLLHIEPIEGLFEEALYPCDSPSPSIPKDENPPSVFLFDEDELESIIKCDSCPIEPECSKENLPHIEDAALPCRPPEPSSPKLPSFFNSSYF